jgi:RHS repeat-associated protein
MNTMKRERSESLRRLLVRMQVVALLCVLGLLVPEALGATNGQPATAGVARVRVTLALWPGENAHAIAAQIGATYRVGVESVMAEGEGVTVVASASDAAVAMLSRDPRVTRIEAARAETSATVRPPSAVAQSAKPFTPQSDATALLTLGPYTYDGSGNVWKVGAEAYEYDGLGRVERGTAATGHQQAYEYDAFGNLEKITTTVPGQSPVVRDLAVDSDTNRLEAPSGSEGVGATYDAVGRVIASPRGDTFTYDALDMVTTSSNGIAKHVHLYTPNDERIASVVFLRNAKQGTNWTIRDTGGAILRRYHESSAGAWTWQQDYIYADGKLLASEGPEREDRRHYFADHLGTPRLITDAFGREVSRHNYYPFGEEIRASAAVDASTERLRFTGHERDYMTGATGPEDRLDYMHARYYENGWGRFLSVDPYLDIAEALHEPQVWNRYVYVTNNPLKFTDDDGRYRTFYKEKSLRDADVANAPPVIKAAFMIQGGLLVAPTAAEGGLAAAGALAKAAFTTFPRLFLMMMSIGGGMTGAPSVPAVNLGSGSKPIPGMVNVDNLADPIHAPDMSVLKNVRGVMADGFSAFRSNSVGDVTGQNLPSLMLGQGGATLASDLGRTMRSGSTLSISTNTPGVLKSFAGLLQKNFKDIKIEGNRLTAVRQ